MDEVYVRNLLKKAFFPWRTYSICYQGSPTKRDTKIQLKDRHRKIL